VVDVTLTTTTTVVNLYGKEERDNRWESECSAAKKKQPLGGCSPASSSRCYANQLLNVTLGRKNGELIGNGELKKSHTTAPEKSRHQRDDDIHPPTIKAANKQSATNPPSNRQQSPRYYCYYYYYYHGW